MKTPRLLLAAIALALASCDTAPPPIDPATGKPMTFNKALGIGLMRLASEEAPATSLEESIYGRRYDFGRNTVPTPPAYHYVTPY